MPPSTPARGATRVTILPDAGRDDQLKRWGLADSRMGARRRLPGLVDALDDGLHAYAPHQDVASRTGLEREAVEFLRDGGWSAVEVGRARCNGGLTAHRGVLHPDEYVHEDELQAMVEHELGFTYEQVRSVYRQGPLSAAQRELRGKIDARLLALSRAGGCMASLGRALGLGVINGSCQTITHALNRGKTAEAVAA